MHDSQSPEGYRCALTARKPSRVRLVEDLATSGVAPLKTSKHRNSLQEAPAALVLLSEVALYGAELAVGESRTATPTGVADIDPMQ